jgi:hypothetical protein
MPRKRLLGSIPTARHDTRAQMVTPLLDIRLDHVVDGQQVRHCGLGIANLHGFARTAIYALGQEEVESVQVSI